jgi:hypothetical protein
MLSILRRILVKLAISCGVILAGAFWVAPMALSFYTAKTVPPIARVTPVDLRDHSVSQAPGLRLSYVGYDFEIPWSDLDEAKTILYPKHKREKTEVVFSFRSGLRLMVTAVPAQEFTHEFAADLTTPSQPPTSDYVLARDIYEFSPEKMHYLSLSSDVQSRDQAILNLKSMLSAKSSETGIFNIQNASYKGFQQGNPQVRQDSLLVTLYSDDGSVQLKFWQKDYPAGVTQAEINRIVQSLQPSTAHENYAIAKSER